MKYATRSILAIAATGLIGGPVLAGAGTTLQGSDSTNYTNNTMEVCDNEQDTYGVHGDFTFNYNRTSQRFDEVGGFGSGCDHKAPGSDGIQGLWRHRTVEERPAWNDLDETGPWHTH